MERKIVFMFSGMGSQYFHMGEELMTREYGFAERMHAVGDIIYTLCGEDVIEMIYDDSKSKFDPFDHTVHCSLAIIAVEYALARFLIDRGIKPDYLLGTSLGEFSSVAVSNPVNLPKIIQLLHGVMEIMENRATEGRMIGILDSSDRYHQNTFLHGNGEIAADNFASHFVFSCEADRVSKVVDELKRRGITFHVLPVKRAFHSSSIDPLERACKTLSVNFTFAAPEIPYISCADSDELLCFDGEWVWNVLRKPIQFRKSVDRLCGEKECVFIDLGPSGTLANFVKYHLGGSAACYPVLMPFGNDTENFERLYRILA